MDRRDDRRDDRADRRGDRRDDRNWRGNGNRWGTSSWNRGRHNGWRNNCRNVRKPPSLGARLRSSLIGA